MFGRQNSQFKLPKNFILQNNRGSLTLSIEYHLYSGIHVPGSEFLPLKFAEIERSDNAVYEGKFFKNSGLNLFQF